VAFDKNRGIGKDNKLPWHYPEDLQYFKTTTSGHTVAMGSKTFASIGRALPGRKNVVFTRDVDKLANVPNIEVNTDPVAFFTQEKNTLEEIFVIGGEKIFELALPLAWRLYVTEIADSYDVDTYFPTVDLTQFTEISRHTSGELTYIVYEKEKQ